MKAGTYRHPITVQKLKASVDLATCDRGDDSNWETLVSRRAKIGTKPGKEWFEENQTQAAVSSTFYVRRDARTMLITPAMRVVSYGQVHEVITANIDGDKQINIVIVCTQRK